MKNSSGFTLIEMMIVVAIISILAAIAIPQYFKYVKRSRSAYAVQHVGYLCKTLMEWRENPYLGDGVLPTDTTTTDTASVAYSVHFPAEAVLATSGDPYYNYAWDSSGLATATAKTPGLAQFDVVVMTAGTANVAAAAGAGSGTALADCGDQSMHADALY
ncbi:MAG: prepilin-type N-terminal cleavage/methylation domain-containing protein [Nitrospirae bacterium]|nr:prepilin-type N-terminal cleavage/methylation domain-containing protein [Nitrospirota bacterium]